LLERERNRSRARTRENKRATKRENETERENRRKRASEREIERARERESAKKYPTWFTYTLYICNYYLQSIYIGATPFILSLRFQTIPIQDNAVCVKDQAHLPSIGPVKNSFVFDFSSSIIPDILQNLKPYLLWDTAHVLIILRLMRLVNHVHSMHCTS